MPTLTIPRKLTKGEELVVIPRKEYDEFSQWQKTVKYFNPTPAQIKTLRKAQEEYTKGKYLSLNEFKHKLGVKN